MIHYKTGCHTAQSEVILLKPVTQAEGLETVFDCLVSGAFSHTWSVNGVVSSSTDFPRDIRTSGGTSGDPFVLTIPATSEFDNIDIQCTAISMIDGELSSIVTTTSLEVGEFHKVILSLV